MGTSKDYGLPTTPDWTRAKRDVTSQSTNGNPAPIPPPPDPNDPNQPGPPFPAPNQPLQPLVIPPALAPQIDRMRQTFGKFVTAQYSGGGGGGAGGGGGEGGGGTRVVGQAARQIGTRTGQNLGGFVSAVASSGLTEAARQFGVGDLSGKSAREIALTLADALCDPGVTVPEVDARAAVGELMNDLLKGATTEEVETRLSAAATGPALADLLYGFFGNYIYQQFNRSFYKHLQEKNPARASQYLRDGRHCIKWLLRAEVRNIATANIQWSGAQGKAIVTGIMDATFRIFTG